MSLGNIGAGKVSSGNAVTRALTHSPLIAIVLYLGVAAGLIVFSLFSLVEARYRRI